MENLRSQASSLRDLTIFLYTHTTNYPHESIPDAVRAFRYIGQTNGFTVLHSEDPATFRENLIRDVDVIAFVNNSGEVLDIQGKAILQQFVRAGGGFVGVHGAAATLERWPWYVNLIGATFKSHPPVQSAVVHTVDRLHPATAHFPDQWNWTDEWYNFESLPVDARVLLTVDELTYEGGEHGRFHPISWCRQFEGGRVFYMGIGHRSEAFRDTSIMKHLLGGIRFAAGENTAEGSTRSSL